MSFMRVDAFKKTEAYDGFWVFSVLLFRQQNMK